MISVPNREAINFYKENGLNDFKDRRYNTTDKHIFVLMNVCDRYKDCEDCFDKCVSTLILDDEGKIDVALISQAYLLCH